MNENEIKNQVFIDTDLTGEFGFCKTCGDVVEVAVGPNDRLQRRIFQAVERRGYVGNWSMGQFLARQVAKLGEELGEMGFELPLELPPRVQENLLVAAQTCKMAFDGDDWPDTGLDRGVQEWRLRKILAEAADMQVVLACVGETLGALLNEDVDLMQEAVRKAERDVERGVRSA